jgi:para-nitrobenzyl esterase
MREPFQAFVYNFDRDLPDYTPETQFGAFHSGEIVYAYDNLHTLDRPWEEVDHGIAGNMSDYWVNFARNGDPNGPGLPSWYPYTNDQETVMVIDPVTGQSALPDRATLNFWLDYYNSLR